MVQIDHTQADVFIVDALFRSNPKRPWISVAIDLATRCIVGIYVSFERPNAAAVALLLTRVVFSKTAWLKSLAIDTRWPMHGIPTTLHLDNAAEFRSRALKLGCAEYGQRNKNSRWRALIVKQPCALPTLEWGSRHPR